MEFALKTYPAIEKKFKRDFWKFWGLIAGFEMAIYILAKALSDKLGLWHLEPFIFQPLWVILPVANLPLVLPCWGKHNRFKWLPSTRVGVKALFDSNFGDVKPGLVWVPPFFRLYDYKATRMSLTSVSNAPLSQNGGGIAQLSSRKVEYSPEDNSLTSRGNNPWLVSGGEPISPDEIAKDVSEILDKRMLLGIGVITYFKLVLASAWRDSFDDEDDEEEGGKKGNEEQRSFRLASIQMEDQVRAHLTSEVAKVTPKYYQEHLPGIAAEVLRLIQLQVGDPDAVGPDKLPEQGFDIIDIQLQSPILPESVVKAMSDLAVATANKMTVIKDAEGKSKAIELVAAANKESAKLAGEGEADRQKALADFVQLHKDPNLAREINRMAFMEASVKGSRLVSAEGLGAAFGAGSLRKSGDHLATIETAAVAGVVAADAARLPDAPKKTEDDKK